MSQDLIERARDGRKSPAALKIKVSNLRSRYSDDPIIVVEGVDDVGVYETWLQAHAQGRFIQIVPGSGKEQLLGFRAMLGNDQTGLARKVFFFVDRDYDGLQGQPDGADIFCLDRYSVENYLASMLVLKSIIRDELRIDVASDQFDELISLFESALSSFNNAIFEVNFHIYCCRRLGVKLANGVPDLVDLFDISLDGARPLDSIQNLIKTKMAAVRDITEPERLQLESDFRKLDEMKDHRGKFLFAFFRKWFHCLSDEIAAHPNGAHIKTKIKGKFSAANINHRSCAARSERPNGFSQYAAAIYQ